MKMRLAISAGVGGLLVLWLISDCGKKSSGPTATSDLFGYVTHAVDGPIEGVEVRVRQIVDHTDSNGFYQLANVPQGIQTITCSQPNYNSFTEKVQIPSSDMQYDVVLKKTVSSTFYVADDASVTWELPNENSGQTQTLGIWYCDNPAFQQRRRCFLGLPPLPPEVISLSMLDAAILRLKVQKIGINAIDYLITVREVLSTWSEDEITWMNSPSVSTSTPKIIYPRPDFLDIDVLSIYQGSFSPEKGIRIAFEIDEEERFTPNPVYYKLWSSESSAANKPLVILKYTY